MNTKFAVDTFEDGKVHFFDTEIVENKTNVYHTPTNTSQYINFDSHTPWDLKATQIKTLYHQEKQICSTRQRFDRQIVYIKKLLSWNSHPKHVRNVIINRFRNNTNCVRE